MTNMKGKQSPVLAVIGNGITGITAARVVRKLLPDIEIKVISSESDYFFSRTALMYIYMGHMRQKETEPYERSFYAANRIELIRSRVTGLDVVGKTAATETGRVIKYDLLLLAVGSVPDMHGWLGQELAGVQGLYSLSDLELLERNTAKKPNRAVIVGGGLIGIELAEMLRARQIPVTFLVRESSYMGHILPPEESALICREIERHDVDLRLATELKEIVDDGTGRVGAAVTSKDERLACGLVGLTAGVRPNLSVIAGAIAAARGILIDRTFRTSSPDVYAAGDCAQFRNLDSSPGEVEQLWYTGRMQGEAVGKILARRAAELYPEPRRIDVETKPYDRGIRFNSAKFFTLEWQTYGFVPADIAADRTFYWERPGENRALRLAWERNGSDTKVTGFNFLGMRFRHEVCARWIAEERTVEHVLNNLEEAAFDPELFARHENEIRTAYKRRR